MTAAAGAPRIALVTVNFRNAEETAACLDSLAAAGAAARGLGVFLVENGSGDGSEERLREYARGSDLPLTLLSTGRNLGFAAGSNVGIRAAQERGYSHVALLNNDTRVDPDFAEALERAIADAPEAVIAGFIAEFETGRPAHNLGRFNRWTSLVDFRFPERHAAPGPFDFVSACLMVVPSSVFRRVGLLREEFFLYCEDMEFSLRLGRAGVPLRYDPRLAIRHRVSSTVTRTAFPKDYYRMRNHTWTVMRMRGPAQRALYLVRAAAAVLLNLGNPSLRRQFLAGLRDGLSGRLGHNPEARV